MPEQEITDRNQELLSEILETVRRLERVVGEALPLLEAYKRGGMLGLRTAAKAARRD